MSILTTYPSYFIIICLIIGAAGAFLLYFQEVRRNRFTKPWILSLASIRFVALTLLTLLLLRPILERISEQLEKPIVVVLQDNSSSVAPDLENPDAFIQPLKDKLAELGDDVEIVYYQFDQDLTQGWDSLNGKGAATAGSMAIEQLSSRMSGRNLSAVIFPTDGIFNKGSFPLYAAKNLNVPFFPIGLGDTTLYKDLLISDVQCNKVCFLGNTFPVQVGIEARLCKGKSTVVSVLHKGRKIAEQSISIQEDRQFLTPSFTIKAEEVGMQRYQVQVQSIEGEKTLSNNIYEFYIQVVDDRKKVQIVAHSIHPDINAIIQAIDHSENYATAFQLAEEWKTENNKSGLTILHGIPANIQEFNQAKQLLATGQPCLFIWSEQTDYSLFNQLNTGVSIQSSGTLFEDFKCTLNNDFNFFQHSPLLAQHAGQYPPLKVPFGKINLSPDMQVEFFQKVGTLSTNAPLIAFHQNQIAKIGWVGGEGIWRWRMMDFQQGGNHETFDSFITNWVQYLSTSLENKKLQVETAKKWSSFQNIIFGAHLYDQSFHPLANQNISLTIVDEANQKMEYAFLPNGEHYQLSLGKLSAGSYRYFAKANNGVENLTDQGSFIVEAVQLEQANTMAQHGALRNMAYETGGKFFKKENLNALPATILQLPHLVSTVYTEQQREEWIDLSVFLFIIATLLGTEWFLRKRLGGY